MKIYTRKGDAGSTGLFYGGTVSKADLAPSAYGDVDELQAVLGVARALQPDADDAAQILRVQRELYVLMAELATAPANHDKLVDGASRVTGDMVATLEREIDAASERFEPPREFVVPGSNPLSAALDHARTVARRAERSVVALAARDRSDADGAWPALSYLNRLSDLLWTLARAADDTIIRARVVDRVDRGGAAAAPASPDTPEGTNDAT